MRILLTQSLQLKIPAYLAYGKPNLNFSKQNDLSER